MRICQINLKPVHPCININLFYECSNTYKILLLLQREKWLVLHCFVQCLVVTLDNYAKLKYVKNSEFPNCPKAVCSLYRLFARLLGLCHTQTHAHPTGINIKHIFSKVGPWEISHCWPLMCFSVPTDAEPGLAFKVPGSCQESKDQHIANPAVAPHRLYGHTVFAVYFSYMLSFAA